MIRMCCPRYQPDEKRRHLLGLVDVGELGGGRLLADHGDAVWVLLSDLGGLSLAGL